MNFRTVIVEAAALKQRSAWNRLLAMTAIAICSVGFVRTTRGAGQFVKLDYPASTTDGELQIAVTYSLWIPDGAKTLRGIIVHQHGAGTTASIEGGTAACDLHWQALAKKWDCALLGPSYHVQHEINDLSPGGSQLWFDPRRGSGQAFLKALGEFAAKAGHPEIETVPWALWGHSGGGIWVDVLSTMHPERIVALWLRSGSAAQFRTHPEFVQPAVPKACYAIPIMANPGVKEEKTFKQNPKGQEKGPWWGNLATFHEYREHQALIGFAPDPRTDHECGDSRYLAIPYLDACLAMRLPEPGSKDQMLKPMDLSKSWLAPLHGQTAVPAAEFQGDLKESVWLPNQALAKAWMEYVQTGAVADTTPPPPPFDVRISGRGSPASTTEITWNAEADFESGIGSFLILRDGRELAQVPEKPAGKFGRPLFQKMTYHDTPVRPLAEMRYVDTSAKVGKQHTYAVVTVNSVGLKSEPSAPSRSYDFDGTMSREVLESYLSRAICMEGMFNGRGNLDDHLRMLQSTGVKYVGRSLCLWAGEANYLKNLERAKDQVARVRAADSEMILEACVFEIVSTQVEQVPVPARAFEALGLPVENRNFRYADMLYPEGQRRNWGPNASVPDVSRPETKLWFYSQAASYIDLGLEAIHFGQVEIMNRNDRDLTHWTQVLDLVRSYAAKAAPRHMVLCNGHVPGGGLVREGKLLLDFHTFPLRIMEVPDRPEEAILKVGFVDSIYGRSKGGLTFSGWKCEHLPYLVELDNYGVSSKPGQPGMGGNWVWGYDEISWFAHQTKQYRADWLRYAWDWVRKTDPDGFLEMPGSRTMRSPLDNRRWYYANTPSPAVPDGLGDEEAIRAIWSADAVK